MITYLLALCNVIPTALAFTRYRVLAAYLIIAMQIPWTLWDLANHYYGFLILVPLSGIPLFLIRRERRNAHP